MVIGLGVEVSFAEKNIDFVFRSLTARRNQVLYHPTLKKISESGAVQLVIPSHIKGCDYNYETLIEHIRSDANQAINEIPILVYFEDEDRYIEVEGFLENLFESVAVKLSTSPKIDEFIDGFDKKALTTYREKECYKEPYSLGNHDKSNLWGSLTLLKSLLNSNPDNKDLLKGTSILESNLSEWTYFKKLIKEIDSTNLNKEYIGRLRSESSLLTKISKNSTVLVVEDQLKDGWELAYGLFFQLSSNFELVFAENESEAKNIINEAQNDSAKKIDLILLDVRLDKDRDSYNQDEYGHHVENLSGVQLAKWIRSKMPTIPIIAATASNKSWTLEALLEQGINGYWVKGSPSLITNAEVGIENTLALIKKIHDILKWEQETGHWQNELYRIAEVVNEVYLEGKGLPIFHRQLRDKAKSLQALLMRSFSPFSQELSDGLQLNLAFIIIYSCMNDLVEWGCDINEIEPGLLEWKTLGDSNGYVDDELIAKVKKIKGSKWDDWEWSIPNIDKKFERMPDKQIAIRLLTVKFGGDSMNKIKKFKSLTNKRNALPLIHGKRLPSGSGSELKFENINISDIDSLINLLGSLADQHKDLLDKYGR